MDKVVKTDVKNLFFNYLQNIRELDTYMNYKYHFTLYIV